MLWLWIVLGIAATFAAIVVVLGLTSSPKHVASARATYARPAAEVFAAISGHIDQRQWRPELESIEMLAPQDGKTVFREVAGFGPVTFIVDESVPARRYVVRILDESLPYGGRWTFELEPRGPDGSRTQLTITEAGEVKVFLFRALSRFFSPTKTIEDYLKNLGRKLGESVVPEIVSAR